MINITDYNHDDDGGEHALSRFF